MTGGGGTPEAGADVEAGEDFVPESAALVLVDLQTWIVRDFLTTDGTRVVAAAAKALRLARLSGMTVVHVQYLKLDGSDGGPGSPETCFLERVRPLDNELVLSKYGRSSFEGTTLHHELAARGIVHLRLVGVVTEGGILTTALDALALGYRVEIIPDAVEGAVPADHEAALLQLAQLGCGIDGIRRSHV